MTNDLLFVQIGGLHIAYSVTIFIFFFYVLLTVHLSIILAMTNLMHKFLFFNKFIIFLCMFRALLCSSSGSQIVFYSIWYRHILWTATYRVCRYQMLYNTI